MSEFRNVITPLSDPKPQVLQGRLTYIGIALTISSLIAGKLGAKWPANEVNNSITFIGANWDTFGQAIGLVMTLWGRIRMNWRSSAAALLLGACMVLFASCNTLTLASKDGNGGMKLATSTTLLTSSKQRTHALTLEGVGTASETILDEDETSVAKAYILTGGAVDMLKSSNKLAGAKDANATKATINGQNKAAETEQLGQKIDLAKFKATVEP